MPEYAIRSMRILKKRKWDFWGGDMPSAGGGRKGGREAERGDCGAWGVICQDEGIEAAFNL